MKKFLTVLLVIAVMFTFSFSSAFAAVDETTYSLDAAKTEALNYIGGIYTLADYDEMSQAAISYYLALYSLAINQATDVTGVQAAVASFTNTFATGGTVILNKVGATEVAKAQAQYQAKLAAYKALLCQVLEQGTTSALYAKPATFTAVKTVAEVEAQYAALKKAIDEEAKKVGKFATTTSVSKASTSEPKASDRQAVMDAIRNEAKTFSLTSLTASKKLTITAEIEAALAQAEADVAAAATIADLVAVYNKYMDVKTASGYKVSVGTYTSLSVTPATNGVLAAIKAKLSGAESFADAYTELYNYMNTVVTTHEVATPSWTTYTNLYTMVKNAVEKGTKTMATCTEFNPASTTTPFAYKELFVATITDLTRAQNETATDTTTNLYLKAYMKDWATYTDALTGSAANDYYQLAATASNIFVKADRAAATLAIAEYFAAAPLAATVAEYRALEDKLVAVLDTLTLDADDTLAKNKALAVEYFKQWLAGTNFKATTEAYSLDTQKAIDFLTNLIITKINAATSTNAIEQYINLTTKATATNVLISTLTDILTSDVYLATNTALAAAPATSTTFDALQGILAAELLSKGKVSTDAEGKATETCFLIEDEPSNYNNANAIMAYNNFVATYTNYYASFLLDQYTNIVGAWEKYPTQAQKAAAKLYDKFDKAMTNLGTADKTYNTYVKYEAAKTAYDNVLAAMTASATKKNYTADQKKAVYAAKKTLADYLYEYQYLNKTFTFATVFTVSTLWGDVKTAMTDALSYFSVADQAAIKLQMAKTDAAVAAAKVTADKDTAVWAGIEALKAFNPTLKEQNTVDKAETLAAKKVLAQQYFAKYENKAFASNAATMYVLRDEIIAGATSSVIADKKVTTKKTAKGIQVTCEQVTGATTYKFYRATSKDGAYKLKFTKPAAEYKEPWTYTNTAVKKGTKYYYKVTVVVNGVESEMSTHTGVRTW